MFRNALSCLALAVLLTTPAGAAPAPALTVTALAEPPGGTSVALGYGWATGFQGTDTFTYTVGSRTDAMGVEQATVWSFFDIDIPEPPSLLPPMAPMMDAWATAADYDSAAGTMHVAGSMLDALGLPRAALWSKADADSVFSLPMPLPLLAGGEGEALDMLVDPYGLICGTSTTGGGLEKAVVWHGAPTGPFTLTTLPHHGPGSEGRATGVIDLGLFSFASGFSVDAQGDTLPQVWQSADAGSSWSRTELPLLGSGSQASIHDLGQDGLWTLGVGSSETGAGTRHAALWRSMDGGMTWTVANLGTVAGLPNSEANGLYCWELDVAYVAIVGRSYGAPGTDVATLWIDDGVTSTAHDLNALVVGPKPYILQDATGIGGDPGGNLTICGVGRSGPPGPGLAATGPHAWVARAIGATGAGALPAALGDGPTVSAAPNPFTEATVVSFSLPASSPVRLLVHDVAGRRVSTLVHGMREAGRHSVGWNGRDAAGAPVSPGVYFVRLEASGSTRAEKIVRLR